MACWAKGNKITTVTFTAKKPIKQLVLGTFYDADTDKTDNVWKP
jgi:hypothetical protein